MLRSPPIVLPLPLGRSGPNLSLGGMGRRVAVKKREVEGGAWSSMGGVLWPAQQQQAWAALSCSMEQGKP
jgi:hypothetical protein